MRPWRAAFLAVAIVLTLEAAGVGIYYLGVRAGSSANAIAPVNSTATNAPAPAARTPRYPVGSCPLDVYFTNDPARARQALLEALPPGQRMKDPPVATSTFTLRQELDGLAMEFDRVEINIPAWGVDRDHVAEQAQPKRVRRFWYREEPPKNVDQVDVEVVGLRGGSRTVVFKGVLTKEDWR